jgi:hypothetical protein
VRFFKTAKGDEDVFRKLKSSCNICQNIYDALWNTKICIIWKILITKFKVLIIFDRFPAAVEVKS